MEPIIEHVNAANVFPETTQGNVKQFKAINIAWVEWVLHRDEEVPYLNVERHYPGFIIYEKYELFPSYVDETFGVPIETFKIGRRVPTGRESDVVETGIDKPAVFHIPY